MSNEAFRAAMRERAAQPFELVNANLQLGGVDVYVRQLPFRQTMRMRRENPGEDDDTAEARIMLACMFDGSGQLLLDPLNDEDVRLIMGQKQSDFWIAIGNALVKSGESGNVSSQPKSS